MLDLLRRGAQKEAAKPENGFDNKTRCKPIVHDLNYTNIISHCNIILNNFHFMYHNI